MKHLNVAKFAVLVFLTWLISQGVAGQQNPVLPQGLQRDERALGILNKALTAAGWRVAPGTVPSFRASGTITYFGADGQISGPATILGRGAHQFRLNAELPQGSRSLLLNGRRSKLQEGTGRLEELTHLNPVNMGILTLPYPGLAAVLDDPLAFITYVGTSEIAGRQVHHMHTRRRLLLPLEPGGRNVRVVTVDYFVDAQTNLVLRVADTTHPVDTSWKDYPQEIDYSNYEEMGGVAVPTLVSEKFMGQPVWTLHLNSMNFNTGLTGREFNPD